MAPAKKTKKPAPKRSSTPKPSAPTKPSAPRVHAVIMAGGSGTRFWPLSRSARPKQFLPLTSKRPLIVETAARLEGVVAPKDLWVVCGKAHAATAGKLLKQMPKSHLLVEPMARNTAPAIALACAHVAHEDPESVLVLLPSDQHVADLEGFRATIAEAVHVARQGQIVTLGITPTRPETGYGYIRTGDTLEGNARRVAAFVEKPDVEKAKGYLQSGDYLWNAGIFVFRADAMLEAFELYMPELHQALGQLRKAIGTKGYAKALAKTFPMMPSTSIDYGVAEKADNIAVVPGSFGWSDVGSFHALPEVQPLDERGNLKQGDAVVIDSDGCVVIAGKRPVAVVGLKDMVVVDAGDAILVLPREKSQDVRKVVEALKARGDSKYL